MVENNPWPASMQTAATRPHPKPDNAGDLEQRAAEMLAQLASALAPRYQRIEVIRRAGAHSTFRARRIDRNIDVTLRVFPGSQTNVVEALTKICAPDFVALHESVILPDGNIVLVMHPISGTSLLERIRADRDPLPEATVLNWMRQVCEGMSYVAARKIVHRNLKPANIQIDESGMAHIIGFDLATVAGSAEGPAGTLPYMAPEYQRGQVSADERSDIYSVGATFYHALTGQPPDRQTSPQHCQAISARISDETDRTLERCLESAPENRFQSFVELLTQLENPTKTIRLAGPPPELPGYHLLSRLGEGGMGVVYKARAADSQRLVALKFIRGLGRSHLDLLARFRVEAEAVACLRHANIVPVLDIGAYGGYPYLALEYVDGGSLQSRMGQFVSHPTRAIEVVAGVARGLHHSHRLGILHRDLKPQNILLSPDGTPKITDFGLAKFTVSGKGRERLWQASIMPSIQGSLQTLDRFVAGVTTNERIAECARNAFLDVRPGCQETVSLEAVKQFVTHALSQAESQDARFLDSGLTETGDLVGTPAYMAPEQTVGDPAAIVPETDIYALGVVLYQLLSGHLPFAGNSVQEMFEQIRHRSPAPLPAECPAALSAICLRCMSKQPGDRYRSAQEVADQLQEYLDRKPTPQTRRWRLPRWWR